MSRERITDADVSRALRRVTATITALYPDREVSVTLHRGNGEYKVTNKLIVTVSRESGGTNTTQVWADAMAGYTARDAYNALRLMSATLDLVP